MALQPSPLLRGFEQGADGTDTWNDLAPGGARGPLALDPQAQALARQFYAIRDGLAAGEQKPIWNPDNPVGTDQLNPSPQQTMGMPDPSFRPGVFVGGGTVPMSQEQLEGMRQGQQEFYDQASLLAGIGPAAAEGQAVPLASRRPLANPPPPGFTIYYGLPHEFAPTPRNPLGEFDPTKIGTGEGAQRYGVGAGYGAEEEAVAQRYRQLLAGPRSDYTGELTPEFRAALKAEDYLGLDRPSDAIDAMEMYPDWRKLWDIKNPDTLAAHFDAHQQAKYGGQGHMYEVNVAADPERFLHWDRPLSEQHPDVQKTFADMGITEMRDAAGNEMKGGDIYKAFGDPHAAALTLQQAGIPGIRYLDQGSRGAGEGTHNVVVFSPEVMNIIRRYGLAGLMAGGGAAALAGGGGTQEQ